MANVRIYGYTGIIQIKQMLVKQFSSSAVFLRDEPYLWSVKLALNGAVPVEMPVQADDKATMVFIEVDNDASVRFEYNPNGPLAANHRNASTNSPRLTGDNPLPWVAGATLSFVDASAV